MSLPLHAEASGVGESAVRDVNHKGNQLNWLLDCTCVDGLSAPVIWLLNGPTTSLSSNEPTY